MKKIFLIWEIFIFPLTLCAQQNIQPDQIEKYLFNQDYTTAISLTDSILKADTTATWAWYLKGRAEMGLLRYREARYTFGKAGKYFPDSIPLLSGMGTVANALGDYPEAIRCFRQILTLDSTNTPSRIALARALARYGNLTEAIRQYTLLLKYDPHNFAYHKELGQVYLRADSVSDGIWHLHDAINLNNHDLGLAFQLANLYIKQHDMKLARDIVLLGLQADSTYTPLLRTLGYLRYLDQKYPEALQTFQTCMTLGDSSLFVRKYLAYTLYYQDKFSEALPLLQWVYHADTTAPEHAYYLGLTWENLKQYDTANTYLQTALRLYNPPKQLAASIYHEVGNNYYVQHDWVNAYESYRESYALDPKEPTLLYSMGVLCEQHLNDKTRAIQYYQALVNLSDMDKDSMENWKESKVIPLPVMAYRRIIRLREDLHFEGKLKK